MRKALCAVFALAFAVGTHAGATQPAAAIDETAATPACELHLWGAVKVFPPNSRFAAVAAPKGSANADRSRMLSNINVLDPVLRLAKVPDEAFAAYFEDGVHVTVVRHTKPLDVKTVKKLRQPLSQRLDRTCHADLVLSELGDIDFPNGVPSTGIVEGLLMAKGGMYMRIAFARYDGDGRQVASERDKVRGDLAVGRSQWHRDVGAALASINDSVTQGIAIFAKENGPFEPRP